MMDLECLTWDDSPEVLLARHEAGHVAVRAARGELKKIAEVTILPPPCLRLARVAGRIHLHGQISDEQLAELPTPGDVRDTFPDLREPDRLNPYEMKSIGGLGASCYSGVAAEFPDLQGGFISSAAWISSEFDRCGVELVLASMARIYWSSSHWCQPAFDAAARIVDGRWGEVLAVTAALLERKTLTGLEVADLVAEAPQMRNHRRPTAGAATATEEETRC